MFDDWSKEQLNQRTSQDIPFVSRDKDFSNRFVSMTLVFQYLSVLTFNPTLFFKLYLCVVRECLHRLVRG